MSGETSSDLFKEKAQDWDKREMQRGLSQGISRAILEEVSFAEDMQIMDFGAGTGLISGHLAPHVQGIAAVDISEAMLAQLMAKPELAGKVTAVCQNILDCPLEARFDRIVSAMALHHVADTAQLFQTFAAHLKPGGQIALADLDAEDGRFHPPEAEGVYHAGFERTHIQQLLEKSGFEAVAFVTAHTVHKEERAYPVFLVTATYS